MVSDMFEVVNRQNHSVSGKMLKLRAPVVISSTRLPVSRLLRFHVMVKSNMKWREIPGEYKNDTVTFEEENIDMFVVFARPIPEFHKVTSGGQTIISDKDENIQIDIPEGAVDGDMLLRLRVLPMNNNRIARYREYEPSAFAGILALTDILSVSRTMDRVFRGDVSVQLPINGAIPDSNEIRCLTFTDNQAKAVSYTTSMSQERMVRMSCSVPFENRLSGICVRPWVSDEVVERAAMYEAGLLHMCTILIFLSKLGRERFLTIEVAQSEVADETSETRRKEGYYEILDSRTAADIKVKDRVRIELAGNIETATLRRETKFAFLYSDRSRNNRIQVKIRKAGSGTPYCIVGVRVGNHTHYEVHFDYPEPGRILGEIKNRFNPRLLRKSKSLTNAPSASKDVSGNTARVIASPPSSSTLPFASSGYDTQSSTKGNSTSPPSRRTSSSSQSETPQRQRSQSVSAADHETTPSRLSTPRPSERTFHGQGESHRRLTSDPRPRPISSSTVNPDGELFAQSSLLELSKKVTLTLCQQVLLSLNFDYDRLMKTFDEAKTNGTDQVFLAFLRWYQSVRGTIPDGELADKFIKAFEKAERRDLSMAIQRAHKYRRNLQKVDFKY